jgi:adenylate cyclase class 2
MSYEIELKYAVADVPQLLVKLGQFGLCFGEAVEEYDTFYQHPVKDYVATDECLRIRLRAGEYRITYKGPKVDRETKTRREIELFLTDNAKIARQWDHLLQALGFRVAAELKKTRRSASLVYQEQKYELSLDHIDGLGDFIELETTADTTQLDEARRRIKSLAATLELTQPITTSYLELSQAGK